MAKNGSTANARRRRWNRAKKNNTNKQNQLNKYGDMSKFTSPGSKAWEQIGTTPETTGAARAWCMAAMDPAHARKYGCVGIPDNNRTPTVVACDVNNYIVTENSIPTGLVYYLLSGSTHKAILTKPVIASPGYIKQVQIFSHPCYGTFMLFEGSSKIFYDESEEATKYPWAGVQLSQVESDGARPISMGHTVQNVGAWSTMGGYFTGGHVYTDRDFENPDDVSDMCMLIGTDTTDLDSYITYQGGSAAGCYNICRMRNLDAACFFADSRACRYAPAIVNEASEATWLAQVPTTKALNQLTTAWDWAFTTYACVTEKFTLRVTEYWNMEIARPYSQGGSDGARYDRAALEFVLAILDQHNFVFEAKANDGATLAAKLRLILAKYKPAIMAAMAAAGAPAWVKSSAGAIISGIAKQ